MSLKTAVTRRPARFAARVHQSALRRMAPAAVAACLLTTIGDASRARQINYLGRDVGGNFEAAGTVLGTLRQLKAAGADLNATGPTGFRMGVEFIFDLDSRDFALRSLQPAGNRNASGGGTNISRDGSCVVGYQDSGFSTPFHALRWTEAAGPVDLGTLDAPNNGSRTSSALAASDDCNVIVGYSDTTSTFVQHAFRWTASGGMVDLGAPAGPARASRAFGVSGAGDVVVGDADFRDPNDPFAAQLLAAYRWTATGGFVKLGGFSSIATAVTRDGGVIVGTHGSTGGAFRWTQAGGTQTLGALPGHGVAVATGVSDNGKIVVGISGVNQYRGSLGWSAGVGNRAFRWTAAGGMQDLRQLLVDAGVDMTGVALLSVTGISADGQWITGVATTPTTPAGESVGYIAQYCDDAIGAACVDTAPAAPSFALAASASALSVAAGQSGSTTLTITPEGGFNTAVTFACSGLPQGATCSFAPATVTPAGAAGTTTLKIATDGGPVALWLRENGGIALALLLPVALRWRTGERRGARRSAWFAAALIAAWLVACGGGGGGGDAGAGGASGGGGSSGGGSSGGTPPATGTPAGTSTVTVTATSGGGASTLSRSVTLTLAVTR